MEHEKDVEERESNTISEYKKDWTEDLEYSFIYIREVLDKTPLIISSGRSYAESIYGNTLPFTLENESEIMSKVDWRPGMDPRACQDYYKAIWAAFHQLKIDPFANGELLLSLVTIHQYMTKFRGTAQEISYRPKIRVILKEIEEMNIQYGTRFCTHRMPAATIEGIKYLLNTTEVLVSDSTPKTAPNDLDIPQEPTQNDVIVKEVLQYSINYKGTFGVSMLHRANHWGIVFRILADEGLVTNSALNFCKYVESLGLNYPTNVKNPSKSSIHRGTHDKMSDKTFDEWANNIPANDEKAKKMKAFGEDLKRKINELQHPKSEKSL